MEERIVTLIAASEERNQLVLASWAASIQENLKQVLSASFAQFTLGGNTPLAIENSPGTTDMQQDLSGPRERPGTGEDEASSKARRSAGTKGGPQSGQKGQAADTIRRDFNESYAVGATPPPSPPASKGGTGASNGGPSSKGRASKETRNAGTPYASPATPSAGKRADKAPETNGGPSRRNSVTMGLRPATAAFMMGGRGGGAALNKQPAGTEEQNEQSTSHHRHICRMCETVTSDDDWCHSGQLLCKHCCFNDICNWCKNSGN